MMNGLARRIAQRIAEQPETGWSYDLQGDRQPVRCIVFAQYMEFCLYDEKEGYYRSGEVRVGREGDFYTSSYISSVMAECLAASIARYSACKAAEVWEWGAGTGRLSRQLLDVWAGQPAQKRPTRYGIVEDHPGHRGSAAALCRELAMELLHRPLQVIDSEQAMRQRKLSAKKGDAILIFANELLDAFPVHRVQQHRGELVELGVSVSPEGEFHYVYMPLSDSRLGSWLERDGVQLAEGQQTELNLAAAEWLRALYERIDQGRVIIIDYGHEAAEYTALYRMRGTLLCYSGHQASDSPFQRIGEQDLTAHVPFTPLRREAAEQGWKEVYYGTQKQFLIDNGVFDLLQNDISNDPFSETAKRNRAVRQLLLSDGMSETFKVLILEKE
ncbi:class I SAM-dependent methyltransferase [Paenibacillus radicis (ex Gao et al. 2016)]|uniref:SAM-dependent methyltransferase n=1 Tax=Paenibacillus radicis (ex Gao et al. 2016) TaxID=1737354 RepID=A0A917HSZ3_9BACL|nr:SAM-dependent methyltransferase [Paenibacillus radicis (ex Gao et al. 2016)]GGG89026.1 SAM-dependent methyltransferase [Paenibacillus radicis (ex Gao et al. 2016)]